MPDDLGPERLTLRQADQTREDFAQILDELNFLRGQIARLPTKSEVCSMGLRLTTSRGLPPHRSPLARPGQKLIVIAQANLQSPNR